MLVRLSRAPVLSGGLRRKTQLSPVPSTWSLPPRPHLTSPKVLKKFKTPLQVPVFPGSSPLCHHTKKKTKIEQSTLLSVDLWSGREKKKRETGMARKRAENREGSLGFPGKIKQFRSVHHLSRELIDKLCSTSPNKKMGKKNYKYVCKMDLCSHEIRNSFFRFLIRVFDFNLESRSVFDVEGGGISLDKEVDTIEEDSIGVNMLESTTLDIEIGGSGCKTVATLEDMEGSSSAWVDEDDVEITGVDINLFCLGRDESGWSKFNGGHFIFVMFSSVWVELFIMEGFAASA
ncbi:hypothetical protein TNCV_464651 [Trichonephila clavipes]|nr:hypothetical protein TNCV_464651 [Trichonephila clavipes]